MSQENELDRKEALRERKRKLLEERDRVVVDD
jgi:hypothetical protein